MINLNLETLMLPTSPIEEIKNKLDIVEVIGSYIKLKKTGLNYRGLCPFHSENKPSFFVSPTRQIWHCFGCSKGGDVFGFVKEIEGVEFGDALRILAQKAGVEITKQSSKWQAEMKTARQRLYDICELSCSFFEKQLEAGSSGKEAKNYLLKRGINEESIKKWRLGYSPDAWRGLSDFLVGKGYTREEVEKAGLVIKSESSQGFYDRFRGRIMFPVFDLSSQVVGFGGRMFETANKKVNKEEEAVKYINIPQTLLYDKGRTLYGLNNAKVEVRKKNQCILVEGYTDVIMSFQAGFENTAAVAGTALTPYHLNILKRYSENLVLAFDMDVAGDTATKRGIDLAQEKGFGIKIVKTLSRGSDPADIILKNPEDWDKIIKEAQSILDFYFHSAFSSFDAKTPEGKKEIGKIILPVIKRIPNKIEQSHWVQELARRLAVREEDIFEELKKTRSVLVEERGERTAGVLTPKTLKDSKERKQILEEKIVSLILKEPESLNLIDEEHLNFFSERSQQLLKEIKGQEKKDIKTLLTELEKKADKELKNFLAVLSLRAEIEYKEDAEEEVQLCLAELKSIRVKNDLKKISEELKIAEQSQEKDKIDDLMKKFNKLTKEL